MSVNLSQTGFRHSIRLKHNSKALRDSRETIDAIQRFSTMNRKIVTSTFILIQGSGWVQPHSRRVYEDTSPICVLEPGKYCWACDGSKILIAERVLSPGRVSKLVIPADLLGLVCAFF